MYMVSEKIVIIIPERVAFSGNSPVESDSAYFKRPFTNRFGSVAFEKKMALGRMISNPQHLQKLSKGGDE
jgi:hypothetical protein